MSHVLIIEDNKTLALGLRNNFEIEGYQVTTALDGKAGLRAALDVDPDLVILDVMMPKMDGFKVLAELRKHDCTAPVLMLTARSEEIDKVQGLRSGADDYVTKPFGLMELMARVEALLRRGNDIKKTTTPNYHFGDVTVNTTAKVVTQNGKQVELAPKEYDLLLALLRREGAVASRLELMKEVWNYSSAVVSRTVDTHIAELRRKLEADPANPKHIITLRKTGYRLDR